MNSTFFCGERASMPMCISWALGGQGHIKGSSFYIVGDKRQKRFDLWLIVVKFAVVLLNDVVYLNIVLFPLVHLLCMFLIVCVVVVVVDSLLFLSVVGCCLVGIKHELIKCSDMKRNENSFIFLCCCTLRHFVILDRKSRGQAKMIVP